MKQRSRGQRRHYNYRAKRKADRVIRQWAVQMGTDPDSLIEDLNPSMWSDNLKQCDCTCCGGSPRYDPWGSTADKLTKEEIFSKLELEEARKTDWISKLYFQEITEEIWNCTVLGVCKF